MPTLELPHTPGCLVCGRENPHGLHLSLHVNPDTGIVEVKFTPQSHHIGFQGIVHGGLLATVIDEAMVWAASWTGKRFCLCGEMSVRFRNPAKIGTPMICRASVVTNRSRLIATTAEILDADGLLIAEATGKYVPLDAARNREFVATFVVDPHTEAAANVLRAGM